MIKHYIKKKIAKHVITVLNCLVKNDQRAIRNLFSKRVECNKQLANHPTVQVRADRVQCKETTYSISILGLLNGLIGIQKNGWGYLCTVYDVVCPTCGSQEGTIRDLCPECSKQLELGELLYFTTTSN